MGTDILVRQNLGTKGAPPLRSGPILVRIPGADGYTSTATEKKKVSDVLLDEPPYPCTIVVLWSDGVGTQGKGKSYQRNLPPSMVAALKAIRRIGDCRKRSLLAAGFSRGAKWVMQLASLHSDLMDFAIMFAGYPSDRNAEVQAAEARALLRTPLPMDVVQYQYDHFCSPATYVAFTSTLSQGVKVRNYGSLRFKIVAGEHEDAYRDFVKTEDEIYARLWSNS